MSSAADFCTVSASTKRRQSLGNGQIGAATTNLSSLLITPLWPASGEILTTLDLKSPREAKQCYHVPASGVTLPDVKEGDLLVIGSTEYPVDWVGEWTDSDVPCLHMIVHEVKLNA